VTADRFILVAVVGVSVLLGAGLQTGVLSGLIGTVTASVAGVDVPPLDDSAMIRRGAAHYDAVCAGCHASPDRPDAADALMLSPPPPKLHQRIEDWSPEALFQTVKHGVPRTAMPAWPAADRDDEVWSMVAFLLVLPGLDADSYRSLVTLPREGSPPGAAVCARCHGEDGRGTPDGAFPRLDIQSPEYLMAALQAFRDGRRSSGFMQSAVTGLKDEELAELARHYGRSLAGSSPPPPPAAVEATAGRLSCIACHGSTTSVRPEFPTLAGQYLPYLIDQFERLSDREHPRGGGPFVALMHDAARLTDPLEAADWLQWYSQQRP
jgi:cytochrome c553